MIHDYARLLLPPKKLFCFDMNTWGLFKRLGFAFDGPLSWRNLALIEPSYLGFFAFLFFFFFFFSLDAFTVLKV